jgi:hypothetical protein
MQVVAVALPVWCAMWDSHLFLGQLVLLLMNIGVQLAQTRQLRLHVGLRPSSYRQPPSRTAQLQQPRQEASQMLG